MPRKKLTDAFVKSAKPIKRKLTEYADAKERGLSLRVTPAGIKSWTYRYRLKSGVQRRMSLGKVDAVSLAEARQSVIDYRSQVGKSADPASLAMLQRQDSKEARSQETVKDIGDWYFEACKSGRHKRSTKPRPKRPSTIKLQRYYFDKHIVPAFGRHKLSALTRSVIQRFVDEIAESHSPSTARQCRIVLLALFNFAIWQDITDKNHAAQVSAPGHEARERILKDNEVRAIWMALSEQEKIGPGISLGVGQSIKLALVTLQRRSEITGMRLDELDLDRKLWIIPGERTKNHRAHVVPLSDLAVELIGEAIAFRFVDSPYVFPSPRNSQAPINPHAMTRAFGRMRDALGLDDMRPHDLRRTAATNLTDEGLKINRFIVSQILNHSSDTGNAAKVTGIYDRNDYLTEKRYALDAWANRLSEIIEGKPASLVIPLRS